MKFILASNRQSYEVYMRETEYDPRQYIYLSRPDYLRGNTAPYVIQVEPDYRFPSEILNEIHQLIGGYRGRLIMDLRCQRYVVQPAYFTGDAPPYNIAPVDRIQYNIEAERELLRLIDSNNPDERRRIFVNPCIPAERINISFDVAMGLADDEIYTDRVSISPSRTAEFVNVMEQESNSFVGRSEWAEIERQVVEALSIPPELIDREYSGTMTGRISSEWRDRVAEYQNTGQRPRDWSPLPKEPKQTNYVDMDEYIPQIKTILEGMVNKNGTL